MKNVFFFRCASVVVFLRSTVRLPIPAAKCARIIIIISTEIWYVFPTVASSLRWLPAGKGSTAHLQWALCTLQSRDWKKLEHAHSLFGKIFTALYIWNAEQWMSVSEDIIEASLYNTQDIYVGQFKQFRIFLISAIQLKWILNIYNRRWRRLRILQPELRVNMISCVFWLCPLYYNFYMRYTAGHLLLKNLEQSHYDHVPNPFLINPCLSRTHAARPT